MKALRILLSLLLLLSCIFFTFSCNEKEDDTVKIERKNKDDENEDRDEDRDEDWDEDSDEDWDEDWDEDAYETQPEFGIDRSKLTDDFSPLYDYNNEKYCYVDYNGNVVIGAKFDYAYNFDGEIAEVEIDGARAFINRQGEVITDLYPPYEADTESYESDYWDFSWDEDTGLYGFVDMNDEWVISPQFEDVWDFSDGIAPATLDNFTWGFINESGEWAIEPQFDYAYSFNHSRALVSYNGKYGYINKNGTMVIDAVYDDAETFHLGLAKTFSNDHGGYYIDTNGNNVIVAYYNTEELNPCESDSWWYSQDNETGLYGFVDMNGEWVISPQFEDVWEFNNGLAPVTRNGEDWGYIDESGEFVTDEMFDYANSFGENGLALVECGDFDALLTLDGRIIQLH